MARYLHFQPSEIWEMDDEEITDWLKVCNEILENEKKAMGK